jgi:PAS domain S-box-containing protein
MKSNHNPTLTASNIALVYALISLAWILFSDQLLAAAATTGEALTGMQAVKGWAFVLTTSVLIFFLMRQEMNRIFRVDAAASSAYGYRRDELLTLRVQDLREPDTLGLVPDQMTRADAEGILFETVHRRKDGSSFPVEISSRGATINGVRTLISIGRDITERKRSEEALRNSELQFRNLADSMPQLVWTATPDGRMDYFNRRIGEFQGVVRQPDGSWEWSKLVRPEDLRPTVDAWQHAITSGLTNEIEHRLLQRDGSYKWYLSRTTPVRDPQGRIAKWYATSTEIDFQKKTEAALAESEARLRLALDSAQMGIWELDLGTSRIAWDDAHLKLYGVTPDQFEGTVEAFYNFVHPEDRVLIKEATRKAIENRSPYKFEFRVIRPDGELRWMRSQGRVICDRGDRPSRVVGMVWDITPRKQAEQQLMDANRRLDFLVTETQGYQPGPWQ